MARGTRTHAVRAVHVPWAAALLLLLALLLLAGGAAAEPAASGERHGVAVLPPRIDPVFASIRTGLREWLVERLETAGVGVVDRAQLAEALRAARAAGSPIRTSTDTPPVATRVGAAMVLMSELRFEEGAVDLRLRLHDGADGGIVTAATGEGRVAELGDVAKTALLELLGQLEFSSERLESSPAPRLSEWSALGRARERLDANDLVGAWRELGRVHGPTADRVRGEIEVRGEDEASPVLRSRLANATGRPDRDWLRVRNALRHDESVDALLAAADAAASRGDTAAAVRFYTRAAEVEPDNLDAQLGRAQALAEVGKEDEAAEVLRGAAMSAPDDPRPHARLAALETVPADERARHWMRAGDLHAERLEPEAAREDFEAAGALDGDLVGQAYQSVARLNERLGNHGEALLGYEQSAELGTRSPEVLLGLGRTRAQTGDLAGAEVAYEEVLALDAEQEGAEQEAAERGLGETLVRAGRVDAALPHLEKAVALEPADLRARRGLARAHATQGQMQEALAALDPARLPADASPRERAGVLHDAAELQREQGQLAEAELLLAEAVQLEPDDPPIRTALATVYELQGKGDRARGERALVAGLTGVEMVATSSGAPPPADGGADPTMGAAVETFAALMESFPPVDPKSGQPLGRVLMLGLEERTTTWEGRIRRLLHPRRPDLEALELALLAAVAERFPIETTPPIPERVEGSLQALRDFGTERETIATVNTMLESDAILIARLTAAPLPGDNLLSPERLKLEVRLFGGASSDSVFILANTLALGDRLAPMAWNEVAALPWLLILALLIRPIVRGWGTVVVQLHYDMQNAKGFFNVRLSRRPGKVTAAKVSEGGISKNRKYQQKVRTWSRLARNMVDPESTFRFVPARSWYVSVFGLLQDPKTREVVGNYLEERQVRVERGKVSTLEFDFRAKEAPIDVRLTRGTGEEESATTDDLQGVVSVRGRPQALRYLRGGSALIHVPDGQHVVMVGYQDRVLEQQVLIQECVGASLTFPIDRDDAAVFTGCPEAVEPYMNGDLPAASQALDRAGLTELANVLRAEYHKERGENAEAARYFQAAGRVQEAAELSAAGADVEGSATLFEQAGDFGKAADQYRQAGDLLRAAAAYEAAYDYDAAVDCYRQAEDHAKVIELCEKTGANFDAAQASLASGDEDRAIRNLQLVDLRDPSYVEACRLLAELFGKRGDLDLAVDKIEELVSQSGEDAAPLELLETFGDLLERGSRIERAIEVFETIRKRDYAYPGAAARITTLRETLQSQRTQDALASGTAAIDGAATRAASAPVESRYAIEGELGRGGMGVVYRARDTRLGRIVALKRLPENLRENETAVQLFLREARAAAALNHPNIVTLFDADEEGGNYYLTMEHLDGLPLDAILRKRGKLSARDAIRLAVQVCTGLHYAHERKIVHRDIKTSNLFFTRDRVVKIMDFGLAKMMEEVRRAATVVGGTPYYMAPEQAVGEGVDHRADLYALGVTLFELVTGTVPFREGDVTYHHRHTPPPDPRTLVPELPEALAALILQLMAKDKEGRPASAGEVGARLAEIAEGL